MDMQNNKWKPFCDIYQKLQQNGCLCHVELNQLAEELMKTFSYENQYIKVSGKNDQEESLKVKLLCTGIVWLIGKNSANLELSNSTTCSETLALSKCLKTDVFFDSLVHCMCTDENKFLCQGVQKALTIFMYLLPQTEFLRKFRKLLNIIKVEDSDNSKISILRLIKTLLYFSFSKGHMLELPETLPEENERFSCKTKHSCQHVDVKKLKYCCCQETCQEWPHLIQKFLKKEVIENKQELVAEYFELWKSLINVIMQSKTEELYNIILKKKYIIELLLLLNYIFPVTLYIALEIVVQALSIIHQLEITSKDQGDENQLGEAVANALNSGLLENVLAHNASRGFGGVILPRYSSNIRYSTCKLEISFQCDRSLKQAVLMTLKALAGSHDMKILLTAYFKMEMFVKEKMSLLPEIPAYSWILQLFLDQDDLLLDAMLASLNIYLNLGNYLGDAAVAETVQLRENLNPHKMFILFLSELGKDHHILLEFLMSSETCILLYLMQYLKLILYEWENFIKAHGVLHYKKAALCQMKKRNNSRIQKLNLFEASPEPCPVKHYMFEEDENTCDLQTSRKPEKSSVPDTNYRTGFHSVSNNLLVPYSSSSSSESDQELYFEDSISLEPVTEKQNPDVYSTIQVLKKLHQTIERLLDRKEFPYNAQPLIHLLKECVIKYITLNFNPS